MDDNGNAPSAADQKMVQAAWDAFDLAKAAQGQTNSSGDLSESQLKDAIAGLSSQTGADKKAYDQLLNLLQQNA